MTRFKYPVRIYKMTNQIISNKPCISGLYGLALKRIKDCERVKGEIIPFPKIFERLCCCFSIKKQEAFEILFIMRDFDLIEIKKFHGVIIK